MCKPEPFLTSDMILRLVHMLYCQQDPDCSKPDHVGITDGAEP